MPKNLLPKKRAPSKKPLLNIKEVAKFYQMGDNTVKALDGISIDITEGHFIAIMGPSGSGKSTAMNIVGSLDTPTKGNVTLQKENIASLTESQLAQLRGKTIGFIFQSFNLIPNLTAKENIMLPQLFQDTPLHERSARADHLLELVELHDRGDHYPNQLSGGQQQRVAIARSLANDPDIILADEPTGNLDTHTGEIVMEFLQKLNNEGKTVIMVTHDPDLAKLHAKTTYWLKDGKVDKITKRKGRK
ncbi:hypothetical protein CMI48_04160 [Candidatus Pacearchaeota archaeon]|nr:hypothetical protein [Candidatus Pacearchaeota archaeon]